MKRRDIRSCGGNALVVSVLLLLSLTSVGIVALSRTGAELSLTGGVVRSTQTTLAGEAASIKTLGDFRSNLQVEIMKFEQEGKRFRWRVEEGSTALGPGDQDGLREVVAGDPVSQRIASKMQALAFSVGAVGGGSMGQVCDVPGFEVNEVCFSIFDFEAKGMLPRQEGETPLQTSQSKTSKSRFRARVMIGPWKPLVR